MSWLCVASIGSSLVWFAACRSAALSVSSATTRWRSWRVSASAAAACSSCSSCGEPNAAGVDASDAPPATNWGVRNGVPAAPHPNPSFDV
jgi:hypothetical protein